jgi:hypothetical protein
MRVKYILILHDARLVERLTLITLQGKNRFERIILP